MRLAGDLKAEGAAVWLDQLSIEPGSQWDRAIEDALKSASCMLLILSPASAKSKNVMDEVNFALDEDKTLVPVLYQDCEVPWRLRRIQYIDFRTDYHHALRTLIAHLNAHQAGTATALPDRQVTSTQGSNRSVPNNSRFNLGVARDHKLLAVALSVSLLLATVALLAYLRSHRLTSLADSGTQESETDSPLDAAAQKGFTPPELARLYNFPAYLDGSGQTIALIELGGGYRTEDLQQYFKQLKLPLPHLTPVNVDGGENKPTTGGIDGQVVMDIEVAGAVAPRANIVVYFAGNSNEAFAHAVRAAANNNKNPTTIMLICWGSPESSWTTAELAALNDALQDAALRHGITTVVADGNNGASDGIKGARAVDFPASSPWVLAVGGTTLDARNGKIQAETVWNRGAANQGATGGGVSDVFPQPQWQAAARIPSLFGKSGRALPDVAASADAAAGYIVRVDGQTQISGGTSGSAPLWAGLIALLNQGLGHNVGYMNPTLYTSVGPSGAFNDVNQGNNSSPELKGCTAGPGWDYCSGWGTPNGIKLLEAFRAVHP